MADGGSVLSNRATRNGGILPGAGGSTASPFWQANDPILIRLAVEGYTTASAALELGVSKNARIKRGR
jgi:hypothetical protein